MAALSAGLALSSTTSTGETLQAGQSLDRELAGGASHRYRIALVPGDFLRVVVEQRGIDVVLSFEDPAGKPLVTADSVLGARGPEEIDAVAEVPGAYVVDVRSLNPDAASGRYAISTAVRHATAEDFLRAEATRSFSEGARLSQGGLPADVPNAIACFRSALDLSERAGERRMQALALHGIAASLGDVSSWEEAIAYYERALFLSRALDDGPLSAATLFALGSVRHLLGRNAEALADLEEALAFERLLGYRAGQAEVLVQLARLYDTTGKKPEALALYQRALAAMREGHNGYGQVRTLNAVGYSFESQGESQKALDSFREALSICRALPGKPGESLVLRNVGRVYSDLGDYEEAADWLGQSLSIFRARRDKANEGIVLLALGQVQLRLQRHDEAVATFRSALALIGVSGDRRREIAAHDQLGQAVLAAGRTSEAKEHFEAALALARAVKDPYLEGAVLTNLGAVSGDLGEDDRAIAALEDAVRLQTAGADRAGLARSHFEMARVLRRRGKLEAARGEIDAALAVAEGLRAQIGAHELRASFFATIRRYYELSVDLLMQLHRERPAHGFDALALAVFERSRARSLVDLLAESEDRLQQGADPVLREEAFGVQKRLSALLVSRARRMATGESTDSTDLAELESVRTKHQELQRRLASRNDHFREWAGALPTDLEAARGLIRDDTVLLEYALGEMRSFVWCVRRGSITSRELPGRAMLEAAARRLSKFVMSRRGRRDASAAAAEVSRLLLDPVAAEISERRLLFVTEGALQHIPFSLLPDPGARGPAPLVTAHVIASLPSASCLPLLRGARGRRSAPPGTIAVLADPVFSREDSRVRRGTLAAGRAESAPIAAVAPLTRSLEDLGDADGAFPIERLPFTRREARSILKLAPAGRKRHAFDFDASRETATSAGMGDYRYLHFATHGLINGAHPELSGIVLSMVRRDGEPRDGFLSVLDIFSLRLRADLVTLSACRTGIGKDLPGEGILGMTRAFFYAGASRVLVSLWNVDDVATAALMERFYRGILGPRSLDPASALRAAQTSLMREKRWASPYYWAGFVLEGDVR